MALETHQDYVKKIEIEAIADKNESDIYIYPSLVALGENDTWHPVIHGESENTLDLGGQFAPNTVAIKELIGRGNFLKGRQDEIITDIFKLGGLKNLWIDGAMRIWDDGVSGDVSATYQPTYPNGLIGMRFHSYPNSDGIEIGVHGTTYHWEKVIDSNKQWLKLTHIGATENGYIFQRFERTTLQYLKGKTVTLSFDYKCGQDMIGTVSFYNEQDVIHDVSLDLMGSDMVKYIGDNLEHRVSVTVTLSSDNIIPDDNAYFGVGIGYGGGLDGLSAIPNGSIQFTNIQFEVNDKATDFEFVPESIDRDRYNRFYQTIPSIRSALYTSTYVFCEYPLQTSMRKTPTLVYTQAYGASLVGNYSNNKGISLYFNTSGITQDYESVSNIKCDARLY